MRQYNIALELTSHATFWMIRYQVSVSSMGSVNKFYCFCTMGDFSKVSSVELTLTFAIDIELTYIIIENNPNQKVSSKAFARKL